MSEEKPQILKNRFTLTDTHTGSVHEFDSLSPTLGKEAIDLRSLRDIFNLESFDPAFKSTASCLSEITYIDGEQGTLLHRGYNIKDLTEKSDYISVCHLLTHGELPTPAERQSLESDMVHSMGVKANASKIIWSFSREDAPMDILSSAVSAISASSDDANPLAVIAQLPALVAMVIRQQQGKQSYIAPDPNLGFTENFLRMAFADENGHYQLNPVLTEAMDKLFILHADHEQNASTSVVRGARSAGSKMAASVAAGVITLAGPLHGGANQKVLEQLEQISSENTHLSLDDKIAHVIERAKDKNDDFRLMGFGHRVYKNRDPRAVVLKSFVDNLLDDLGIEDERLDIARKLESAALSDPYFADKKLYPNVDFYSGIAMSAMNMEPELFTLIFAAGRVSGWVAQALELDHSKQPICRPRQQYIGHPERKL